MTRLTHGGVTALLLIAAGCASNPPQPVPRSVIDAPRSERGNPNFYEVFGRRYHVMPTAEGYRESGVASWYGHDFHGRSTSSGERYDMFALTAAHKTLPLPTWVEVTNRENGKRIIVKVNDRGPFVGERIIDLSYAAALELDMVGAGTAPVFVRALGAPAVAPIALTVVGDPLAAGAVSPTGRERGAGLPAEKTFVQVGAFAEHANASRVLATLKHSGVEDAHVHAADVAGGIHRVHVGPLATENEYDAVRGKLRALGLDDGHLVLEPFLE